MYNTVTEPSLSQLRYVSFHISKNNELCLYHHQIICSAILSTYDEIINLVKGFFDKESYGDLKKLD